MGSFTASLAQLHLPPNTSTASSYPVHSSSASITQSFFTPLYPCSSVACYPGSKVMDLFLSDLVTSPLAMHWLHWLWMTFSPHTPTLPPPQLFKDCIWPFNSQSLLAYCCADTTQTQAEKAGGLKWREEKRVALEPKVEKLGQVHAILIDHCQRLAEMIGSDS